MTEEQSQLEEERGFMTEELGYMAEERSSMTKERSYMPEECGYMMSRGVWVLKATSVLSFGKTIKRAEYETDLDHVNVTLTYLHLPNAV